MKNSGGSAACGSEPAAEESTAPETTESTAPESEAPASEEPEDISGNVTVNGSTSMESVILALIEGFADV